MPDPTPASTTSSSAPAPPAACSRTAFPPTAATRVLLLEAGPRDTYPWIHIPIGYAKTMFHPVAQLGLLHGAANRR